MDYRRGRMVGSIDESAVSAINYYNAVLTDTPLAFWKCSESSGTAMLDSSGNGRHGTYSSPILGQPSITPSLEETSVYFNGSSGVASVSSPTWCNNPSITVEMIINIDVLPTTYNKGLINRYGYSTSSDNQFAMNVGTDYTVHLAARTTSNTFFTAYSSTVLSAGTSYHIAGVFNANDTVKIYINGVEEGSTPATGSLASSSRIVEIGRYAQSFTYSTASWYQNIAIYGTALSSQRILDHATAAGLA